MTVFDKMDKCHTVCVTYISERIIYSFLLVQAPDDTRLARSIKVYWFLALFVASSSAIIALNMQGKRVQCSTRKDLFCRFEFKWPRLRPCGMWTPHCTCIHNLIPTWFYNSWTGHGIRICRRDRQWKAVSCCFGEKKTVIIWNKQLWLRRLTSSTVCAKTTLLFTTNVF